MMALHVFVNMVTSPYAVTVLLLIVGLVLVSRRGRQAYRCWGARVLLVNVLIAFMMGSSSVCEAMAWWLEKDYPAMRVEALPSAEAIVVLGGGIVAVPEGSRDPYPNLCEGADRVWHAARIWKVLHSSTTTTNYNLRIYCTCPDVSRSTPPFLRDLGVPDECIVPLDGPWNTEAEAKCIARAMQEVEARGGGGERKVRVYLVTSALHMKRAVRIFTKYAPNLEIVPAATDHMIVDNPNRKITWRYFVPNMGAFNAFGAILHEYIGLIRYAF